MKKTIYLIGLLIMSLAFAGCGNRDRNNGQVQAFAPNSCFNNGFNNNFGGFNNQFNNGFNNQFNGGFNQFNQRFQWRNGQCIDVQDGGAVRDPNLCQNINLSGNPNCTHFGQGNGVFNGPVAGAFNACSIYNTAVEQFYPVYYPNLGTTVCAGYSAYATFYQHGVPAFYPGFNNVFHGCTPGYTAFGCSCKTLGGTLGWFSAGVTLGVCY
jgi:hypothetical protein